MRPLQRERMMGQGGEKFVEESIVERCGLPRSLEGTVMMSFKVS